MYNSVNPAVIKSILSRMSADDLQIEIDYMEARIEILEEGNKLTMFERLLKFAKNQPHTLKNS